MACTGTPCFYSFVEAKRYCASEGDDVKLPICGHICQNE